MKITQPWPNFSHFPAVLWNLGCEPTVNEDQLRAPFHSPAPSHCRWGDQRSRVNRRWRQDSRASRRLGRPAPSSALAHPRGALRWAVKGELRGWPSPRWKESKLESDFPLRLAPSLIPSWCPQTAFKVTLHPPIGSAPLTSSSPFLSNVLGGSLSSLPLVTLEAFHTVGRSLPLNFPLAFGTGVYWFPASFLNSSFSFLHSTSALQMQVFLRVYSSSFSDPTHHHLHTGDSPALIPSVLLSSKLQTHVVNGYLDNSTWTSGR